MALVSREFRYFCFGCLFLASACLEITVSSSELVDGDSFRTGSQVNFTCSHQTYQGIQIWKFDAVKVLDCGFLACDDTSPEPNRFDFFNDLNKGIFIFSIEPVEPSDNGKDIECSDGGANAQSFKMKVKDNPGGFVITCDCLTVVIVVVIVAWTSALVLTCLGSYVCKYCLDRKDLLEWNFAFAALPCIYSVIVLLLYRDGRQKGLIPLLLSFIVDGAFIGVVIYLCLCKEICEMMDLLRASGVYVVLCVLSSSLKYVTVEICCANILRKKNGSISNPGEQLNEVANPKEEHPQTSRTLPRLPSLSSRLGNETEYQISVDTVKHAHRPFPPIARKEEG